MVDGATELIMTKADVLDTFDTIKVAVAYKIDGKQTTEYPYDVEAKIEPIYKEFKGWKTNLTKITKEKDFPVELAEYIKFIEKETGVPVKMVSVGPDRQAMIER